MMKLKKRRKRKEKITLILIIILLGLFSSYLLIKYFSKKVSPIFFSYAEAEVIRITTLVVTNSVNDEVIDSLNTASLYETNINNSGEIQLISFNSEKVMEILSSITKLAWLNLKKLESGNIESLELFPSLEESKIRKGIIYEIPFGAIHQNSFLSNLGPKIPVRIFLIGNISSNIETKITEYGINNALVKVIAKLEVTTRVKLPFASRDIKISTEVPLDMKIINGQIPNFYSGGFTTSSNEITSSLN